ncbi:MAG: hypothetical protein Q9228_001465 [Teloschistes exilis]
MESTDSSSSHKDSTTETPQVEESALEPSSPLTFKPTAGMRVDLASLPEPRVPANEIPPWLHPSDRREVDEDHLSFLVVFARLWPSYLLPRLNSFYEDKNPGLAKEFVTDEVKRLMLEWCTMRGSWDGYPFTRLYWHPVVRQLYGVIQHVGIVCVPINREMIKTEYERRVRRWHVNEHLRMYQEKCVQELRNQGRVIGL